MTTAVDPGTKGVRWDLTPLAPSEEAMKERLEAAVADAAAFVERWSAKSLETIESTSLLALLRELADIRAACFEAMHWAFMLTKTDSENPAVLDIRAWVDNRSPRFDDAIRHFELAWMALPDDRVRSLAEDEAVARDRHYLLSVRRFRPFMLSPAEDREDLPHHQRRQPERGLVEQHQARAAASARGRSPASAARRPRACRPAGVRRSSRRGK